MKLQTILATAILSATVSTACNQIASSSQQANNKKPNENSATQTVQKEAARISLADAKAAFDAGKAVFIDTRDVDSYNSGHIKGAIQMSAQDVAARFKELPADKQIIAYCS